jgi:hypothetical protein
LLISNFAAITGSYVDPKAGKITFAAYFGQWSARQVWVPGTVLAMKLAVRSTTFSEMPMRSIRPSHVESWVKSMAANSLAPGTITTRFNNVRAVFRAARKDKVIGADPAEGITLPRKRRAEAAMTIPTPADIGKIMAAADVRFRRPPFTTDEEPEPLQRRVPGRPKNPPRHPPHPVRGI